MAITDFTSTPTIKSILARCQTLKQKNTRYSDIEDAAGNQYVDLVQEGGGVLGIALVGYTYVLENAGIRFFSLAGTSAGAINTMMMAALGRVQDTKSEKVLDILNRKDLFDLVDGDSVIKKLIKKLLEDKPGIVWSLIWNALKIYKTLKEKLGVNPGKNFEQWITAELKNSGINSVADVRALRKQVPDGLKCLNGTSVETLKPKLAIITSEITTHTKVILPEMAAMYWKNPDTVSPAELVRASMSIPFFFEPYELKNLPNEGKTNDPNWDAFASYHGPVPPSVKFVDGGLLSNFPISVFHRSDGGVPRMPTFGARLSTYRSTFSKTDTILSISGSMISTMRQIHDYDFLIKNPDYCKLICRIDADLKFNWLNFNMSKQEQVQLFELGATKAIEFLETFDWEGYKQTRAVLAKVH